jgi:nitrogen fixation protein NifU and related proteins
LSDLRQLYQEIILDHYRKPRHFGPPEVVCPNADHQATGHNPLCGDRVKVFLHLDDDDRIDGIGFDGNGCAISTASASMMMQAVAGKSRAEALELFQDFRALVTGQGEMPEAEKLGELEALAGVRELPVRVKCATLAWHTLKAALEQKTASISTEVG